jgi:hypothetical protein
MKDCPEGLNMSDANLAPPLLQALRNIAVEDPDICTDIQEQSVPPRIAVWAPEKINRLYFALLQKVSKSEAETRDLKVHIQSLVADAAACKEAAQELETDLKTVTSELEAKGVQLDSTLLRLASAEETVRGLKASARSQVHISPTTSSVDAALSDLREFLSLDEITPQILPWQGRDISSGFFRIKSAAMTNMGVSMGSVRAHYSSMISHLEKPSSDLPPLRRCHSAPSTIGEQMAMTNITIDRDLLQDPNFESSSLPVPLATSKDPGDDATERESNRAGLLPVQANHMQNKSLRHVSDTTKFNKTFARHQYNQRLGYKGRNKTIPM